MIEYSRYDSPMSTHSFLSIIYKRRKIILTLFLLIVTGFVGAAFLLPPKAGQSQAEWHDIFFNLIGGFFL